MTEDEHRRLEIAALFLEIIIDRMETLDDSISDLAWAAHSYLQSVLFEATFPCKEAQLSFANLLIAAAIKEAKTKSDPG